MSLDLVSFSSLLVSLASICVSVVALYVSTRDADRDRINANSWETYKSYNEESIRRGRKITRQLQKNPDWSAIRTYAQWSEFFQLDSSDEQTESKLDEQAVLDLTAFYHQTGLLLTKKLLDEDFTMQLVGDGFEDRWPVIQRIPLLFPDNNAYVGVYDLHARYVRWNQTHRARVTREAQRIRDAVKKELGQRSCVL